MITEESKRLLRENMETTFDAFKQDVLAALERGELEGAEAIGEVIAELALMRMNLTIAAHLG